jgi:hypothetical protein
MSDDPNLWKITMPRIMMTCANCLAIGLHSPAIKGWDGAPICREHVAEAIANTCGQPKILPPPGGYSPSTITLQ